MVAWAYGCRVGVEEGKWMQLSKGKQRTLILKEFFYILTVLVDPQIYACSNIAWNQTNMHACIKTCETEEKAQ